MAEKKYYYQVEDCMCLEVCPYLEKLNLKEKEQIKIGSLTCRQCIHNIETSPYNEEKGWVICKKMKEEEIPSRDKKVVLFPLQLNTHQQTILIPEGTEILSFTCFAGNIFLILLQPTEFQDYKRRKIEIYDSEQTMEEGNRKYIGHFHTNIYKFVFEKIV